MFYLIFSLHVIKASKNQKPNLFSNFKTSFPSYIPEKQENIIFLFEWNPMHRPSESLGAIYLEDEVKQS